eukprot:2607661-Pyramimonas_sp.AAC.1
MVNPHFLDSLAAPALALWIVGFNILLTAGAAHHRQRRHLLLPGHALYGNRRQQAPPGALRHVAAPALPATPSRSPPRASTRRNSTNGFAISAVGSAPRGA